LGISNILQLGETEAARGALRELLALKPDFAAEVREEFRQVVWSERSARADRRRLAQGRPRRSNAAIATAIWLAPVKVR
jgi:hypothetical protein